VAAPGGQLLAARQFRCRDCVTKYLRIDRIYVEMLTLSGPHFAITAALFLAVISFFALLFKSLDHADDKLTPQLLEIEHSGSH